MDVGTSIPSKTDQQMWYDDAEVFYGCGGDNKQTTVADLRALHAAGAVGACVGLQAVACLLKSLDGAQTTAPMCGLRVWKIGRRSRI